jgi:DNA-binding SARP family transcriptional activator/streptogramin lyase
VEFRILGPLEVVDGAQTIPIRPGKDRAVLALLLLHANAPVSSERLIDELWGEAPPPSAAKILQSSVSRLRRQVGVERLETLDRGYVIHAAAEELDATRFEQLLRDGRARDALVLWRGTPLAGLEDGVFAASAQRRLEELRFDALEQRIDADLAEGRGAELIPELEDLAAGFPFRERLQGQLMRALYSDGRQNDALEVYRRTRAALDDELGLQPSPQLQELERAILRQDSSLPKARPPGRPPHRRRRVLLAVLVVGGGSALAAVLLSRGHAESVVITRGSVVAIDPATNRVIAAVPLGGGAQPGELAGGVGGLWVANAAQQTVVRIDPQTRAVVQTYDLGVAPADVAVDAHSAWVVTGLDNSLERIDLATGKVRSTPLPRVPAGFYAVATGGGAVWVAGETLLRIDPRSGAVSGNARGDCCSPKDVDFAGGAAWVGETSEAVAKVGATSMRQILSQNVGELDLRVADGYGALWVTGTNTYQSAQPTTIWRLNETTGLPLSQTPVGHWTGFSLDNNTIAVGAGGVWVAVAVDRAVFRLDPHSGRLVAVIPTTRPPWAITAAFGRVWVSVR